MTGKPLVYLTPNCTPFFNKVVQPFKGRAVGQPNSTIQKKYKKFCRFKKNTFLCSVTNIKNMKVIDFKTQNATFICGAYKVIVLSPIYLVVDLQLPLQVLPLPLSVLKDPEKVFNELK